jgi:hypothetical protein
MRQATTKQSSTRVATKAEAAKTAKLEADKKKRKKKVSPPPAVCTPTISTPATKEVEEDEDETTGDPPIVEDRTARSSLSPTVKRQRELEQQVTEEDLHRMREAQQPVNIRVRPLRPKLRASVTVR